MRPIVIHVPTHSQTVQKIITLLNDRGAKAYYGGTSDTRLRDPLVIGWGYGGSKLSELRRLTRAGVASPRYSEVYVAGWIPRRRNHAEATDFTDPPAQADFWTEPVVTDHEFRVHVLKDYVFRTQYKLLPEGTRALVKYGVPIRNHSLGWRFTPRPERYFTEDLLAVVRDAGLKAVRALDLDMGAADVGLVGSSRPVVFEVNTRPSIDEYTMDAYVQALMHLARQ